MSNAIVVPDTFKGPVATVFAGAAGAGDDLSGGITGGYGLIKFRGKVWSIQHHGTTSNLMREDGDGPRGSIDVVIVKANAQLSKTWYENGWDENNNNPPDCASANGIVPDQGVPKPQASACLGCPKNAWNSAPGGGKGKACGDHRRMAVVPLTDLKNEFFGGPLLLRCPAASLQDMAAFDARYKNLGYPYFTMAIKIGFDPQESFPKFTFAAIRPLTEAEGQIIMAHRASPETARVVNEGTAAAVAQQIAKPQEPVFSEPVPADAIKPQVSVRPAAVAQPAQPVQQPAGAQPNGAGAAGAPAALDPVRQEPAPAPVQTAGGFGPVAAPAANGAGASQPAQTQPVGQATAQQPAQAAQRVMTGFGPVAAEPAPASTAAPANGQAGAVQTAPAVVTAFEGSIDDRLNELLKG
jgi:hypothetical protein